MFLVVPNAEAIAEMTDHVTRWTAAGQVVRCHLYKNNLIPGPSNVLTDFTEVLVGDFPGYAPQLVSQVGTPFVNAAGNTEQQQQDVIFQPTSDPAVAVTIYGFFLTLHPVVGADTLLGSCRFDAPFVITSATQAVPVDPDVSQVPLTSPVTQ